MQLLALNLIAVAPSNIRVAIALLAGLVIAIAGASIFYFCYYLPKQQAVSAAGLFRYLCRAHHLNAAQRRLLENLCFEHNLSEPGLVFLDAQLWEVVSSNESTSLTPKQKAGLQKLRPMLFSPLSSLKKTLNEQEATPVSV